MFTERTRRAPYAIAVQRLLRLCSRMSQALAIEVCFDIVGHLLDDKSNDAGIIKLRRNNRLHGRALRPHSTDSVRAERYSQQGNVEN